MKLSLPNNSIRLLALASVLSLPVSASHADIITLFGNLTGALEVPPTGSQATGQVTVTLDTFAHTMRVESNFSGLGSNTTAAHIHCCLASPFLTGVNVPVRPTLAERIVARASALPPEVLEKLPADGASQHDHYIYGTPKRPS